VGKGRRGSSRNPSTRKKEECAKKPHKNRRRDAVGSPLSGTADSNGYFTLIKRKKKLGGPGRANQRGTEKKRKWASHNAINRRRRVNHRGVSETANGQRSPGKKRRERKAHKKAEEKEERNAKCRREA